MVITDPHIRVHPEYAVYHNGTHYEEDSYGDPWTVGSVARIKRATSGEDLTSIFVKTPTGNTFEGDCWPGKSVWFDFMNEHAQAYWKHLMLPEVFKGTNYLYNFWIDMNEPSIFHQPHLTMQLDSVHLTTEGAVIFHRDVHNLYGTMSAKTAYEGLQERNHRLAKAEGANGGVVGVQRPFVLTRAFFLGSQKYGAYWTGDNRDGFDELSGSVSMLLSAGVAGFAFGGADVPGFFGDPSDHTYVLGY